jgi:hypothetical protein
MILAPAALVVAHPGHELRLHRWLELARPMVLVLTDGSGSGRSRIDSTFAIVGATGSRPGAVMGAFTDHEMYRLMLSGDVEPIVATTLMLSDLFVEQGIRTVVADAFEWYNPTHDLCAVMASLAAERAALASGRSVARCEYAVTESPAAGGETFELDDEAMARKLTAAHSCSELAREVESLIAKIGLDALRREVLRPVEAVLESMRPAATPFYETHGEKRVASGQYGLVIRWDTHLRPFLEKLTAAVRGTGVAAQRARVS